MSISFDAKSAPRKQARAGAALTRTSRNNPPRWIGDLVAAVAGVGFGVVCATTFVTVTYSQIKAPGGLAMFVGNLTAMLGTYLAMLMILLVSRLWIVEKNIGQDRLVSWHRKLGPWPISLLVAHAVFTTIGYAQAQKTGLWHEFSNLVTTFPNMLSATIALGIMVLVGIATIKAIRDKLKRETWWTVHLFMYLALALSFAHEIGLGPAFVGHPLTTFFWVVAWLLTAGVIIVFRVAIPIYRSCSLKLKVVEVKEENDSVVSIICRGHDVNRLRMDGGQFFCWRFLTKGLWYQSHPFSLSALPRGDFIRLTVKDAGDFSAALRNLKVGTRVAVEGPYGNFTKHFQIHKKAVFIAGGIGVTALRSLTEDLPARSNPIVVVRASRQEDLIFHDELTDLVKLRHGELHELVGSRKEVEISPKSLLKISPDIAKRDVFICGSSDFVDQVVSVAHRLGVNSNAIHYEAFAL